MSLKFPNRPRELYLGILAIFLIFGFAIPCYRWKSESDVPQTFALLPNSNPSQEPTLSPSSIDNLFLQTEPTHATRISTFLPSSQEITLSGFIQPDDIVFYVMGDIPYSKRDAVELLSQISDMPEDARFVFHVGDMNSPPTSNCTESVYSEGKDILLRSVAPVFIIPGDNDWNDCPDPDIAWMFWLRHFGKFDLNWNHALLVERQHDREENLAFVLDFALFIGLNLVGGLVHDEEEWSERLTANLEWTLLKIQEYDEVAKVIVIFGHAHPRSDHDQFFYHFTMNRKRRITKKWFGAQNMMRVQVDQGSKAPPLKVILSSKDSESPISFIRSREFMGD